MVAISLLLSWFLAITIIPLLGGLLLKNGTKVSELELYKAWYFFALQKIAKNWFAKGLERGVSNCLDHIRVPLFNAVCPTRILPIK